MPSLMTNGRKSKYFWPASAITPADMAILHAARESTQPRTPISQLIAKAVRETYGQARVLHLPPQTITQQDERKTA